MKRINLILAVSCLFLFSCEVDSIEQQTETDANFSIKSSGGSFLGGGGLPARSCDPIDADFEHTLTWTAYITGLVIYEDTAVINELRAELNLNQTTKALRLTDLLSSTTSTPNFKYEFEQKLADIFNGTITSSSIVCPDDPAGGPDDGPGGNVCGLCDPYQEFLDEILIDNCLELYFPRGVYTDHSVNITTVAHPLCNGYGNAGFSRTSCANVIPVGAVVPNYVQTHYETIVVARPYVDLSNINCYYTEHSSIDLNDYLSGSWPLGN